MPAILNDRGPRSKFWLAVRTFACLFLLAMAGALFYGVVRQSLSGAYPATDGRVLSSAVIRHRSRGSTKYNLKIRYAYEVGRQQYTCDRYAYRVMGVSDDWVPQFVALHPRGTRVVVYYNPVRPADAALAVGIAGSDILTLLLIVPMALCAVVGWFWQSARGTARMPAGVPVDDDGHELRVRLRDWSALTTSLIALCVTSIVALIGAAVAVGMKPNVAIAWTIVAGVAVVAVAVGMYAAVRERGPNHTLVWSRFDSTLRIPPAKGEAFPRTIRAADVLGFDVETKLIGRVKTGHQLARYVVSMHWRTTHGEIESAQLVALQDPHQADRLVAFLNGQLLVAAKA